MGLSEEALRSSDVALIKRCRSSMSAQITADLNLLNRELSKTDNGKFDLSSINNQLIQSKKKNLNDHFDLMFKLHERYVELRPEGSTDTEEQEFIVADTDYINEIETKVYAVKALVVQFEDELKLKNKTVNLCSSIEPTVVTLTTSREYFTDIVNKVKSKSSDIIEAIEDSALKRSAIISLPVESMIGDVTKSYEDLKLNSLKLTDILNASGRAADISGRTKADIKDETSLFHELTLQLKQYSSMKALFLKTSSTVEEKCSTDEDSVSASAKALPLKVGKPDSVKFSGNCRDFASYKRDFMAIIVPNRDDAEIGIHFKQGIPEKYKHLISNKDLSDWQGMMDKIEEELASPKIIVDQTVAEIEKMRIPTTDKGFVEYVESLEKIERDLSTLNQLQEIANTTMLSKLESKLPSQINHDWTQYVIKKKLNKTTSLAKFQRFLSFLIESKEMAKYNMSEVRSGSSTKSHCFVTGRGQDIDIKSKKKSSNSSSEKIMPHPCLACNADGATDLKACQHSMDTCVAWGSLTHSQRLAKVKCQKHPFRDDHTTKECKTPLNRKCKFCDKENAHHFLLCSRFQVKAKGSSNLARRVGCALTYDKEGHSLPSLPPVMLFVMFTTSERGIKLGSLIDNGSTDDYITHRAAKKLGLVGQPVDLVTEGFGGTESRIKTFVYMVPVYDKFRNRHLLACYGTDKITNGSVPPNKLSYQRLCNKFGIRPRDVQRPSHVDLLISLRSSHLHPTDADSKTLGGMTLACGPLGHVFGGWDHELEFSPHKVCCLVSASPVTRINQFQATTMHALVRDATYTTPLKSEREILGFFDEEQIGIHCSPRCGDCKCGTCVINGKQMSIKEEKEYNKFKSLMYLDETGTPEDPGPYWKTKFPWIIKPEELVNNRPAVTALMYSTEKKLIKNPEWRSVYEQQLLTLVEKGFAKEICEDDIKSWEHSGGTCYFIAHQMALNPQSKSTPVRCCFNSSQVYAGCSLNSSWELGPNLINSLHTVLLRFRSNLVGGQGDVTKMYYMVRIEEEETWQQIWMWRFAGDNKIRLFKMVRLVMGNMSSPGLSGVALCETAKLNDFPVRYPAAHQALTEDTYVDNVLVTADNHEVLRRKIEEIELVGSKGGFYFKPWVVSGQVLPDQILGVVLPNDSTTEEEKALGTYWSVQEDTFYIKADLGKPVKKVKRGTKVAAISINEDFGITVTPHLTLRICLSFHARPFDPLGLILPVRMRGNILFRKCLQFLKREKQGRIPWDDALNDEFIKAWTDYFEMLLVLEKIKFPRSFKPENYDPSSQPVLLTFNDGNPEAFGTVAYAYWKLLDGNTAVRLIMSKARLGPLKHMGETVRNELAGATLSSRITSWIQRHSGVCFGTTYHFLDSMIVRDMLDKDSYEFSTFFGLRVSEIQQKTCIDNWNHIPSAYNVADLLTKGCTPAELGPNSTWQTGPVFLKQLEDSWPITPRPIREPKVVRDSLEPFFRKSKILAVITDVVASDDPWEQLISRCGSLNKLLHVVAYVRRFCSWSRIKRTGGEVISISHSDLEKVPPITVVERDDAWKFLIAWDQKVRLDKKTVAKLVPKEIKVDLVSQPYSVSHIVVGSRIKNFPITFTGHDHEIPIIPYSNFAKLIVQHYHDRYHVEVDSVVSHVRQDCWIIKCRKIASVIDSRCKICKIKRKAVANQLMGDLPDYRTQMLPAFTVVGCDLFGPILIKDDVVKRGPRVTKKVWGVLYSCTTTRAIYLDVSCGYSTEEFLHTLRRLMARHGDVRVVVSDPGTQLVGCVKELNSWRSGWDIGMLKRYGADRGLEWKLISANAQHQNGISEVMIKLVKGVMKSLLTVIGENVLTLNELNTLLCETSQLVNERPIGIQPNENVDCKYLSPASLLLGRCSSRISQGPFQPDNAVTEDPGAFKNRFLMIQAITEQFWRVWLKLYFPTLVIRQKWHTARRNLAKEDICLIKDSNAIRGEWRLARVTEIYPDAHGRVRNVELAIKPHQSGSPTYTPTAPIHVKRHSGSVVVIVPVEDI